LLSAERPLKMATVTQIICTKLAAPVIASFIVGWMWGEGFGWRSMIVTGLGGYVLSKVVITLLIGPREGSIMVAGQQRITDASLRDKPGRGM
jgi:hypothetical protein